jgi:YD repeat-containing protein
MSETDANGRVTLYQIGAFGRITGMRMAFGAVGYASLAQATTSAISSGNSSGWIKLAQALITSQSAGTATSHLQGATSNSQTMRQDWRGRLVESTDSFGKHMVYGYNGADEQTRISDLALGKQADCGYDVLGRNTTATATASARHEPARQRPTPATLSTAAPCPPARTWTARRA